MKRLVSLIGLLLLAALAGKAEASIVVIDFEVLKHEDDSDGADIGPIYSEDGFTLTAQHFSPIANPPSFQTFGTLSNLFAGSTALSHSRSLGEIILTETGGSPFNLISIELAEHPGRDTSGNPADSGPFDMVFTGTQVGGSTVSQTITVDSFLTLKTFEFFGFDNVVSVNWFQGGGPPSSPTHQFDNIVVSPIPEPTSLVVFFTLFAGFGLFEAGRVFAVRPRSA